jgi:S-adenosylmethionine-diacylglycerol 3-amino-3-carboxypropyl transferase
VRLLPIVTEIFMVDAVTAMPLAAVPPIPQTPLTLADRLDAWVFARLWSNFLVYNTCWEDPAVDRQVLQIGADDRVLVITSAGCNTLDYLVEAPQRVYAVDANPRQNALLELKVAGIKSLEFADFFQLFGQGYHPHASDLYKNHLRERLSPEAQAFWDKRMVWFTSRRGSFYFHGLAGTFAYVMRWLFKLQPALRRSIDSLFETRTLEEQRAIYERDIAPGLWSRGVRWLLSRQFTMSMLGVPHPQRKQVQAQHAGGLAQFIRDSMEYVICHLPVRENYFYAVYFRGRYSDACCPRYLMEPHFQALKAGLIDRLEIHTCTVTDFLTQSPVPISRFVLLDHMDWMSSYFPEQLSQEWRAIGLRATPGARVLMRSAHARPAYFDWIRLGPQNTSLSDLARPNEALAQTLTQGDRVHTYAGFHIVDMPQ